MFCLARLFGAFFKDGRLCRFGWYFIMASTAEEVRELLNAEVVVEVAQLRDIAQHGLPNEVRGEVWMYLLGVQHPDKSRELTMSKSKAQDYRDFNKQMSDTTVMSRLRAEIKRYQPDNEIFRDKDVALIFEHVICAYLNNRGVEYYPALVHLCGPFVLSVRTESDVYFCFEQLMGMLTDEFARQEFNEVLARFTLLFRTMIPDLYSYFEDEEVDYSQWATSWLRHLLAKELPIKALMRLWDTYFSTPGGISLHAYVCLGTRSLLPMSALMILCSGSEKVQGRTGRPRAL